MSNKSKDRLCDPTFSVTTQDHATYPPTFLTCMYIVCFLLSFYLPIRLAPTWPCVLPPLWLRCTCRARRNVRKPISKVKK